MLLIIFLARNYNHKNVYKNYHRLFFCNFIKKSPYLYFSPYLSKILGDISLILRVYDKISFLRHFSGVCRTISTFCYLV